MFSFWFSFRRNVCHSLSVPGNSRRSSRNISKRLNFLTGNQLLIWIWPPLNTPSDAKIARNSHDPRLATVSNDRGITLQKRHGVRTCRTPCLERLNCPFSFSGTTSLSSRGSRFAYLDTLLWL